MPRCIDCGENYEIRPAGDIMITVCYDCRGKPSPPPAYVERNGLMVPNPDLPKSE